MVLDKIRNDILSSQGAHHMKMIAALCATCLFAAPVLAQTGTNTTTPPPSAPAPDAGADKPAPTLAAQRGEAPAEEPAGEKPAPVPGAPEEPATPKA